MAKTWLIQEIEPQINQSINQSILFAK